MVGFFEVGDGAGDFEDFIVGAGGKSEFVDGLFDDVVAVVVEFVEERFLKTLEGCVSPVLTIVT